MIDASLPLEGRSGLPDTLAHLRSAYPQEEWRTHRNFGQLAAFWLSVHGTLRREGAEMQALTCEFREGRRDAQGFQNLFVPSINQFLGHLDAHHRIEDSVYFPRFR